MSKIVIKMLILLKLLKKYQMDMNFLNGIN